MTGRGNFNHGFTGKKCDRISKKEVGHERKNESQLLFLILILRQTTLFMKNFIHPRLCILKLFALSLVFFGFSAGSWSALR